MSNFFYNKKVWILSVAFYKRFIFAFFLNLNTACRSCKPLPQFSNTMMKIFCILIAFALFAGCKKDGPATIDTSGTPVTTTDTLIKYSILKDAHYCDKTAIKIFTGTAMQFNVKFDSTCIYNTIDPQNQYDINKLAGFTEGIDNHVNSARIGWSWNDHALRIYAYAYANAVRSTIEICTVAINVPFTVSIGITADEYIFKVNEKQVRLPRAIHTAAVSGYRQYPYFGGDETAPQDMYIYMQELEPQ
jgi:hypothetical protein